MPIMLPSRKFYRARLGRIEMALLFCVVVLAMAAVWLLQSKIIPLSVPVQTMLEINETMFRVQVESRRTKNPDYRTSPNLHVPIPDVKEAAPESTSAIPSTAPGFLNIQQFESKSHGFQKAVLKVRDKSIKIYVYGAQDFISRIILESGRWESFWIGQLLGFLSNIDSPRFVDLGCNVGVYTLVAASFGYRVVAVDANKNNTNRLIQSVIENRLDHKVTVVLNAISNTRRNYSMDTVRENVGHQRIIHNKLASYQVSSVVLDDLLPIIQDKEDVIIKVDVEGSEADVFTEESDFFTRRRVRAVLMEWLIVKQTKEYLKVVSFFSDRNYVPYADFFILKPLDVLKYYAWPTEVVWRRRR